MSNSTPLLLDTHIWLDYLNGSPRLKPRTVGAIELARTEGNVYVSVISVWEIALLVRLKRIAMPLTVPDWVRGALLLPGVNLLSFSPQIAIAAVDLPDPMHKDPCDRILVASARVEGLTLVTRDAAILDFAAATNLGILRA
jgi:PIN domain nuclease of toxin-antitoxin system